MVFEKFIRYARLAVGLKPSARGCEGRLRGLERSISFKDHTPSARGCEARLRGLERIISFKDHTPSARGCEARLRGLERSMYSKTITPRLRRAKATCVASRASPGRLYRTVARGVWSHLFRNSSRRNTSSTTIRRQASGPCSSPYPPRGGCKAPSGMVSSTGVKAGSSTGRAAASKSAGCRFDSCPACHCLCAPAHDGGVAERLMADVLKTSRR